MSPETFGLMQTETSGEFGGLGIEVSMEAGVVKVITPIDDTPAGVSSIGVITFTTPASILTSIPSPPNSPLVSVCINPNVSGDIYEE